MACDTRRADIRIGISGWTYEPWRGVFFPPKLAQRRELEFASRQVNSIEINGTFYSLQKPGSFRKWFGETPDDFLFSVKAPRFITHTKRLKNVGTPLANFFASGVLALGEKLGPILWQLPPSYRFDPPALDEFLRQLPRTPEEVVELARKHDHRVDGRNHLDASGIRRLRHAMEIRHESFLDERFAAMLREYEVSLVVADTAGKWPFIEEITADFIYVRLHGDVEIYSSGYGEKAIGQWAKRVRSWSLGRTPRGSRRISKQKAPPAEQRDVFVYFDNDVKVRAPFDAISLAAKLGLPPPMEPTG